MMGKRVALIGLDGSGKSTNIEKMKRDLDYAGFEFVWARWKPTLLKPIYMLVEKQVSRKNENINKNIKIEGKQKKQAELNANYNTKAGFKKKIFKNPLMREVWMLLALIDYFFQFQFKTLRFVLMNKNIVFDRFYFDLFVDQGINFGYSPDKICKEIRKYNVLFPQIDRYIYIRVSPETCYKRKNDIPNIEYLNERYKIYEYLSNGDKWITIDGERSLEKVNSRIKEVILG